MSENRTREPSGYEVGMSDR